MTVLVIIFFLLAVLFVNNNEYKAILKANKTLLIKNDTLAPFTK